jgi:hypothetical protein
MNCNAFLLKYFGPVWPKYLFYPQRGSDHQTEKRQEEGNPGKGRSDYKSSPVVVDEGGIQTVFLPHCQSA